MWRYIQAAFWARAQVRGLGGVPLNTLSVAGLFLLGFGQPGFWFLGLGLEIVYLWVLANNRRFRAWLDARDRGESHDLEEQQLAAVLERLSPEGHRELAAMDEIVAKVRESYELNRIEDFLAEANLAALVKLRRLYAQLLFAREQIDHRQSEDSGDELQGEIARIEAELAKAELNDALVRSRRATLEILRKRFLSLRAREQAREEIQSDLVRIRSQAELALDQAAIQAKPPAISLDLELSSSLLTGSQELDFQRDNPIRQ